VAAADRLPDEVLRRLELASGDFSHQAIVTMAQQLPFFGRMNAEQRASVQLVVQTGVANFVEWLRDPRAAIRLTAEAFRAAPRDLTKRVSLRQTVEMVRTATDVFERQLPSVATDAAQLAALTEAVLRYGREIAFAAATVYAAAAESRGAWDARLEALVVDGVVRGDPDESLLSRASALGWDLSATATVVVGNPPDRPASSVTSSVRAVAARHARDALVAVQGSRLVAVVSGALPGTPLLTDLSGCFGPGPVVVGPVAASVGGANRSAVEAMAGLRAVPAWPSAPRPVLAADLLAERVLDGDPYAERALLDLVVRPLLGAGGALADTLDAYLEAGGAVESCSRTLFVHANTVRYRLRRVAEVTGLEPTTPRDAHVLRTACAVGRLAIARGTF
jgi:DNA-binding PucR family transcriptional regulator